VQAIASQAPSRSAAFETGGGARRRRAPRSTYLVTVGSDHQDVGPGRRETVVARRSGHSPRPDDHDAPALQVEAAWWEPRHRAIVALGPYRGDRTGVRWVTVV